jgi:glycosyltransferase involved in cell wall biosynthesis
LKQPPDRRVVCHLIERLSVGGAEGLVHRLAVRQRAGDYEPMVCCLEGGPLRCHLERDGVKVVCLELSRPSILNPRFPIFAATALLRMWALVRRHGVAILHAHMPDSIILAAAAGALSGARVVASYHGLGMLPAGRARIDPRNRLRGLLYRAAETLSDRTIAVSSSVRERLCQDFGFSPEATVLILNGVEIDLFEKPRETSALRTELGVAPGEPVITCIARLVPNKGQRFLIEAMSAVVKEHPHALLLLVGDGRSAGDLRSLVARLGLARRVRFTGVRTDAPDILALSDTFVLPSLAEGIPLALIEAMASGKPVVASDVPGCREVVLDRRFGWLVPARDPAALAEAILALLGAPEAAREMGERARERAREQFNVGRTCFETERLYDAVLTGRADP